MLCRILIFRNDFMHFVKSRFHIGNKFELTSRSVDILLFSRVAEIYVSVEIVGQKSYSALVSHQNRAHGEIFAFHVRYGFAENAQIALCVGFEKGHIENDFFRFGSIFEAGVATESDRIAEIVANTARHHGV